MCPAWGDHQVSPPEPLSVLQCLTLDLAQTWEVEVRDCRLDCEEEEIHSAAGRTGSKGTTTIAPETTTPEGELGIEVPGVEEKGEEEEEEEYKDRPDETDDDEEGITEGAITDPKALSLISNIQQHPYLCFSNETYVSSVFLLHTRCWGDAFKCH